MYNDPKLEARAERLKKENKRLANKLVETQILLFAIIKEQGGRVEVSDRTLASVLHYTVMKERNEQTRKTIYYCQS